MTFLSLDLAGAVHNAALCEASGAAGMDSPGWLVRSRILRLHTWTAFGDEPGEADAGELRAAAGLWTIDAQANPLVCLTEAGREQSFSFCLQLGCRTVCLPCEPHVVSPRGLTPALKVKDYRHNFTPALCRLDTDAIRDALVSMMERAADDVQADGLEQDDSFLDRYAEIRARGERRSLVLPLEVLSEPGWLVEAWQEAYALWWGRVPAADEMELTVLHLRCGVGRPDHGFRAAVSAPQPSRVSIPSGWHCEQGNSGDLLCTRQDS